MPFYNYILEADLKSYVPELDRLKWSDETNYSSQKTEAEKCIIQDMQDRGHLARNVMSHLSLRDAGTAITADETGDVIEDKIGRMRVAFTVSGYASGGTKTISVQGSNTNTSSSVWNTVYTSSAITANGDYTGILSGQYKYYKVVASVSGGTMDFEAYLVETTFDRLIIYKWLELILQNRFVNENDKYYLQTYYYRDLYDKLWNTVKIYYDVDDDGDIDVYDYAKSKSIDMLK